MLEREERSYIVKRVSKDFSFDEVEKAPIDKFTWCYDYKPECYGQVVLCEDEFIIKLTCFESEPEAVYKNFGDDVWKDSCLEFFVAFNSDKPNLYMNCEMNSAGAALMSIGEGKGSRKPITDFIGHIPEYKAEKLSDRWSVTLHLKLDDIRVLFGDIKFTKGYKFTANMFKCGDETKYEHYGMWSRSISVLPQFHKSEYFGDFIIG